MSHDGDQRDDARRGAGGDPALFPIFLKLAGRPVLLVGAGPVALAKSERLLAAGARLTVVAPEVHPGLRAALPPGAIHQRAFLPGDVEGMWLVVAAAPPAINRQVLAAAEARCLFVNAVDDPAAGSAYAGATLRRGPVTVAISTEGAAPALAGLVRQGLEALLPDDLEMQRWGTAAEEARRQWKAAGVPMEQRRPLLLAALQRLYQAGDAAGAQAMAPGKGPT